jgi:hypothetical protein
MGEVSEEQGNRKEGGLARVMGNEQGGVFGGRGEGWRVSAMRSTQRMERVEGQGHRTHRRVEALAESGSARLRSSATGIGRRGVHRVPSRTMKRHGCSIWDGERGASVETASACRSRRCTTAPTSLVPKHRWGPPRLHSDKRGGERKKIQDDNGRGGRT